MNKNGIFVEVLFNIPTKAKRMENETKLNDDLKTCKLINLVTSKRNKTNKQKIANDKGNN